jgi:hypothetical protein
MKSLVSYLCERIEDCYYHFTNVENILRILKDGYFITSKNDGYNPEKYSNYISLSRTLSFSHGYAKALINQENVARITINKQKLKSKYKVIPIDTIKGKRTDPNYMWGKYKDQVNVENEDRVLLNTDKIKLEDIPIELILIKNNTMSRETKQEFEEFCKKRNIKFNYM